MTDLWHSLIKSEYSYLKIVAERWGFPFSAPDARRGVDQLVHSLLEGDFLESAAENLDKDEWEALVWLDNLGGRSPWDHFTRRFGEVREMGAGRLDRERPDKEPVSTAEKIWYRALIGRGFFETETGPLEFAYLPDDLREALMPALNPERLTGKEEGFLCRVAGPRERKFILPEPVFILDQLCSLLAGIRIGLDPSIHMPEMTKEGKGFYQALAGAAGLLDIQGHPSPDSIRDFFEMEDAQSLKVIWESWLHEAMSPELLLLPGIEVEGDPPLEPLRVRKALLSFLAALPGDEWWSIESFISQTKDRQPDFLRVGGEYDAWFIKDRESGEYLAGFEHWEKIEGALLRFYLTGPMRWLGLTELGAPEEDAQPAAFRLCPHFLDFMAGTSPELPIIAPELVQLRSQGEIRMTREVSRKARYQIARFCDWYPVKAEAYQYRLSPASFSRAEEQGLRVSHLLSLLKKYTKTIPPNLLAALERWEKTGSQASIETRTVLRLGSPAILKSLKKSRANRYILEQLGPTTVIIHPGSEEKIAQALIELGFFVEVEDQTGSQT